MTGKSTWRVTIDSPGDHQSLAALVAECRHRLIQLLDDDDVAAVCAQTWHLGSLVGATRGTAARIVVESDRSIATPVPGIIEPSLRIEGLSAAGTSTVAV